MLALSSSSRATKSGRAATDFCYLWPSPPPGLAPRDACQLFSLPRLESPCLNPSPAINGLKAITSAVTAPVTASPAPLAPYKLQAQPPATRTPFPLNPEPPTAFFHARAELESMSLFTVITPPLHRRSSSSERPNSTTSSPSSPLATTGELQ
jgi:hypothetical protein